MGWLGIGPQIDGLGHIGIDHVYYNGFKDNEFAAADGLKKLGIEKLPPMVARGVLLDMAAHFGTDLIKEGTPYTKEDIMAAAVKQGVEIREGDVVLFQRDSLPEDQRPKAAEAIASAEEIEDLGQYAVPHLYSIAKNHKDPAFRHYAANRLRYNGKRRLLGEFSTTQLDEETKKLNAEIFFQKFYLMANGRMGQVEFRSRPAKT